jgi:glycosyltransferase involved in cell wall biosynthesis
MKTKPDTLIIITPGFAKDEQDSTCLPAQQNFIKAINRNFPSVKIIIISFQYPFVASEYNWNGNKVIALAGANKGKLQRLLVWQRAWNRLKKIKTAHALTGILSFWCGDCAFIANRFAQKYQAKHFCWLLGQDAKKDNKYARRINGNGGMYIALSDFIADEFYKQHHIKPAYIIPLGIDAAEYKTPATQRDIDVLAAGSLIPLKQYRVFIQVIAVLQKNFPGIKAVLCGDGPEKAMLQNMVNTLSLENNIILTGEKPHEEILSTMQRSKIFIHPSSYEGLGMVCLEALYAGCNVLSFVQPIKNPVQNWHIAADEQAIIAQCKSLLNNSEELRHRVLPYAIDDTALAVMQLFGF